MVVSASMRCRFSARWRWAATRTSRSTAACCTARCSSKAENVPPNTVIAPARSSATSSTCSSSSRSWLTTTSVPRHVVDHVEQHRACTPVEVVRRFVEERDRQSAQTDPGDRDEHGLAARRASRPAGPGRSPMPRCRSTARAARSSTSQASPRASKCAGSASPPRIACRARSCGPTPSRSATVSSRTGREPLGEQVDGTRRRDGARRGLEPTGDQPDERGLAGPVPPDQSGPAGAEGGGEVVERDGAVGPGEAEVVQDDGWAGGHGGVSPVSMLGARHRATAVRWSARRGARSRCQREG